ncbi:hypothetical protein [Azospirillum sp. ST 5-10]|uniref:hypothetical protein n=1 Tax=unclassified Azospirillum TaxID=2630922 RepID=UPI003F49E407
MGGVVGVFTLGALIAANVAVDRCLRRKRREVERQRAALVDQIKGHAGEAAERRDANGRVEAELRSWKAAVEKAQQDLERVRGMLAARRQARPVRYYVFDRLEGRLGEVWLVTVKAAGRNLPWSGTRPYLVVAENERLARERTMLRFARSAGYQILSVAPSPLPELIVQMQTAEFGKAAERR